MPITISSVATDLPLFIGYTETHYEGENSLQYKPTLVHSMFDYERLFGGSSSALVAVQLSHNNVIKSIKISQPTFLLYFSLQLYFANGGGACYIISAGRYKDAGKTKATLLKQMQKALAAADASSEPALLILPDTALLAGTNYYKLLQATLKHCANKDNRFALLDVYHPLNKKAVDQTEYIAAFRKGIGAKHLSYGAAYYPWLVTTLKPALNEHESGIIKIKGGEGIPPTVVMRNDEDKDNSLFYINQALYDAIEAAVEKVTMVLPSSAAAAATCVQVDKKQGVWKSPASMALNGVTAPLVMLNNQQQEGLNIDGIEGKSINAVRYFTGKGTMIFGARTLDGNNNEWRYIAVRRLLMMIETSINKGIEPFVFEPNNTSVWNNVKLSVDNYLHSLWRMGAFQGMKPEHGYFVKVGLGQTMTANDVTEGRMIVEIGVAVLRPAEFIILRITQYMSKEEDL